MTGRNAPFQAVPSIEANGYRRHVLDLDDFSADEITEVLHSAEAMREILARPVPKVPALTGKTLVNLFYEDSTRTRVSFELAGKHLSAEVINVSAKGSSVAKGESLVDTVRTLEAVGADLIVIRHPSSGAPYLAASQVRGSILNAGDGWHAHPSQALLDLLTIQDHCGGIEGRKVVIVGDALHSRVARSDLWGLAIMGAEVVLCGPPTLLPADLPAGLPPAVTVEHNADRAIEGADVVMALRLQQERMQGGLIPSLREYSRLYQVSDRRLQRAKDDVLVMHPGPMNEGIEIDSHTAHGRRSAIEEQVTNGVAIRMALLYMLAGPKNEPSGARGEAPRRAAAPQPVEARRA
jgi:aspartate carbamoyltransferase catalytic subunit